jgi:hypothetical protein
MHRPKPNKLHDELDALLDGRPVELTDELAPLVEAADVLRIELAAYQLDPRVADRHLEQVLERPGNVVQLPVRHLGGGWDVRRRVVAVALAAALVLAPATIASAAALPGQAMYPFKLAIEQVRIAAVQWSPGREAGERTRVADERLEEVQSLFRLKMFGQLPTALNALNRAVIAARVAVRQAQREGEPVPGVAAKLDRVEGMGAAVVQTVATTVADPSLLAPGTRSAIQAAVSKTQAVLPPPSREAVPTPATTPTTEAPPNTAPSDSTSPPTIPPTTSPPTTDPPTTNPPTTNPPTTNPPTTNPPTTGTAVPESVEGEPGKGKPGKGKPGEASEQAGADERATVEGVPPTTGPAVP